MIKVFAFEIRTAFANSGVSTSGLCALFGWLLAVDAKVGVLWFGIPCEDAG